MPISSEKTQEAREQHLIKHDHQGFLLPNLTAEQKAALLNQPSGFHYLAWQKKDYPKAIACDRQDMKSVQRRYQEAMFDPDLKELVRHGIPANLRPTMLLWLSGG